MTAQEAFDKVIDLDPIENNTSLHVDEFVYKVENDEIRLYYAIGHYDDFPLVQVNGQYLNDEV